MAGLYVDDNQLQLIIELDDEPDHVDLSRGLGLDIMTNAAASAHQAALAGTDPATGEAWEEDSEKTARKKGHHLVGKQSGAMLSANWESPNAVDAQPRRATWQYPGPDYARFFHERRPLIGWTPDAITYAAEALRRAAAEP